MSKKYEIIEISSNRLKSIMKKDMLVYDPDLAQAIYSASALVLENVNAVFAYISMHKQFFVIPEGSYPPANEVKIAHASSLYSGMFNREFNACEIVPFTVDLFHSLPVQSVVDYARQKELNCESFSFRLAGIKASQLRGVGSLKKEDIRKILLKKGVVYENLPEIFKRGICIEKDKNYEIQSIISKAPSVYAHHKLNTQIEGVCA